VGVAAEVVVVLSGLVAMPAAADSVSVEVRAQLADEHVGREILFAVGDGVLPGETSAN
jgi:hypothetical protein